MVNLGVIIDSKLSTRDHVVKTAPKAHTVLGMIKRTVDVIHQILLNVSFICYLLFVYIRSVLDYCSPVRFP